MKKLISVTVFILSFLIYFAPDAHSSAIMFTDRPAWEATVTGLDYSITNSGFEDALVYHGYPNSDVDLVLDKNVIFMANLFLEIIEETAGYNSGKVLYPFFGQPITIFLPDNVYAFGFDLGEYATGYGSGYYPPPELRDVKLSTGEEFPGPYVGEKAPTYAFFGFLSDSPITNVYMYPWHDLEPIIDNFTYAQKTSTVPAPASILLLGTGLVGLALRKKFKKNSHQL